MNDQIIYKTKKEAQEACEAYEAEVEKLEDRFGITTVSTSCAHDTFSTAEYLNELTGAQETFWQYT
jgi:hypothetical protein